MILNAQRIATASDAADVSGGPKTTGSAQYVGDLPFEGLEGVILRSPHPHADIISIDLADALATEGVIAVITAADFGDAVYKAPEGLPSDRPPLARGTVRYVGEEIAAIAATSREVAEFACSRIRVRYRRRRPLLTTSDATAHGAPKLHADGVAGNAPRQSSYRRGRDRATPAPSERRVQALYSAGSQAHCCLETHTVVASWPSEDGEIDLWAPSQGPAKLRQDLAAIFGVSEHRIRTHDIAIGGDFGARVKISTTEAIAVALARKSRRMVRITLTRAEEFAAMKRRAHIEVDLTLEADSNGRLTRLAADAVMDLGAYHFMGVGDFGYFPQAISSLYSIADVSVDLAGVYTNNAPPGAFRGAGAPQSAFARECALDELAAKMGIDPLVMRLRNLNGDEQASSGWRIESARLRDCLERAAAEIGWGSNRPPGRGLGLAAAAHVTGVGPLQGGAYVEADASGGVIVRSASHDPGTGQRTILASIAAKELGVDPARVKVVLGETHAAPFDAGLGASKGSYIGANAVGLAAINLAEKLRAAAVAALRVNQVELIDGRAVTSVGSLDFAELVTLHPEARDGVLRGVGEFRGGRAFDDPDPSDGYSYAAQAVEVEVDGELGLVRIVRIVTVHDSGRILNAKLARGQVEGGVMIGVGMALGEELIREGGKSANAAFIDYGCPRAPDAPPITTVFLPSDEGPGRYRSRGVAEICLAPTAAAIANAVADATGIRIRALPITPDKIVAALATRQSRRASRNQCAHPTRWWPSFARWLYPRGLGQAMRRIAPTPPPRLSRSPRGAADAPAALGDAVRLLAKDAAARPLAGGIDMIGLARDGLLAPLVNTVDVTNGAVSRELSTTAAGGLRIGAAATLANLVESPLAPLRSGLRETALAIASPQIRNVATVGGNLLQAKRCWFYRNDFPCYKRSGPAAPCFAVEGDHRFHHAVRDAGRCQAVTPSDLATTLIALDASVSLHSVRGVRATPVGALYRGPGESILRHDEILADVLIGADALARSTAFRKLSLHQGGFAVCAAASSVLIDLHGRIADIRVILGGVSPTPFRAKAVEHALLGQKPSADLFHAAALAWTSGAHPLSQGEWKIEAATTLLRRSLAAACASTGMAT